MPWAIALAIKRPQIRLEHDREVEAADAELEPETERNGDFQVGRYVQEIEEVDLWPTSSYTEENVLYASHCTSSINQHTFRTCLALHGRRQAMATKVSELKDQ
jgi:hypothetical protein